MKKLIDIENLLIWAFQREAASLHDIGPDVTAGYPQDSILRCEQVSLMGGFVKGTAPGARVLASDSHPDAVTVTDAMKRLDPHVARLVASHAKAGSRPDWRPHADFRLEPRNWEWDESGEEWGVSEVCPLDQSQTGWTEWAYDPSKGRSIRVPKPKWVPIIAKDDAKVIATFREVYVVWWDALHDLGIALHGGLADWELSDIVPDREPWVDQVRVA